jgi:hypothetical protein
MLSYLESISQAYINGSVDRDEFEQIWKSYIVMNWLAFQNVVTQMDTRCRCVYRPFQQLGRYWSKHQTATSTKPVVWPQTKPISSP